MATTTITGTINGVNNTALANKWITFRLVQLGTDSGATATVAQSVDSVQTDASGDFSIDVWNNGDSGKTSVLEITIDGSKPESVIIPTGTVSIELWDLIENYQADGSTSEQLPVVSDLFLRKSTNLSDLGDAPAARTNLGVEIGTDVQAHSATLDATTASFTTADETKLDGIEALADVTDATNIAASGGYVAGGTDVALADGGTGASDAPTARANLGVPSESDTLLKSGNLLGLTDTAAARANLGVPSTSEGLAAANNLSELTATASTARTNIDVPSNSEAVLVANNLSDVDPVTARANLGVTSSADALSISGNLSELAPTSSTARTNLGVAIGSDVQAHSAVLDATDASFTTAKDAAISANAAKVTNATHTGDVTGDTVLTIATDAVDIPMLSATGTPDATSYLRGDNTWSVPAGGVGSGDLLAANNLSELTATASIARANIGVSIGSDIQAHSAILDGTTASFTTAIAAEVTANTAKVTYPTADSTKLAGYSPIAIITDATTARSLALTDIGAYIRLTNAASCTITLPANATVAWASETEPPTIYFRVAAAGIPTLSNAGVTVNDTLGVVAALEAGSTFALQWVATDVWDII